MKILYHHRTRSRDGQSVHIDEMIHALRAQGVSIRMVEPQRVDAMKPARRKQLLPKFAYELLEFGYSGLEFLKLSAAILRERPDAIYERANIYMLSGLWAARLFSLPLLLEVNAPITEERGKFDGLALPRLARWTEETAWRGADYVFPVTDVLGAMVRRAGAAPARVVVLSNGVDLEKFSGHATPAARHPLKAGLILGFVGYIRSWHGLPQMVELLAKEPALADAGLLVVGDGPGRGDLETRAKALGIEDRVHVTGVVGRDALTGYIGCFDIALQPEVTPYASPLKLFEYMALGRAIVAPDAPNIREILTDGENALLFEPDNSKALLAAVRKLAEDEALRRRLGAAAADKIRHDDITWSRNARRAMAAVKAAQSGKRG